jgi:hypothetical protein
MAPIPPVRRILESAGSLFEYRAEENASQKYPLLDALEAMAFAERHRVLADATAQYLPDFPALQPGNDSRIGGCRFDGSTLRYFLRLATVGGDEGRASVIRSAIEASLTACRQAFGYAAIRHSGVGKCGPRGSSAIGSK